MFIVVVDREVVTQRIKKLQKGLPSFDYNTQPRFGPQIVLEEAFVDAWADLLISAGWMDREEMTLRECNWAIVRTDGRCCLPSYLSST